MWKPLEHWLDSRWYWWSLIAVITLFALMLYYSCRPAPKPYFRHKPAAPKELFVGPKGGTYYLTPSGRKVYVKSRNNEEKNDDGQE